MDLRTLALELPHAVVHGDGAVVVRGVTHDSRVVAADSLFCCVHGAHHDGHDHAAQAVAGGAVALLCERPLDLAVPQVVVPDVRAAMGPASAAVFGHPSKALDIVGVTGTNGKTTTTHLVGSVAGAAGLRCGVLGTLSGPRTTPEAPELQSALADLRARHYAAVAMEISSHALDARRIDGTSVRVAVFTNLGRDHLDHHGTMERYFEAKARLFHPDYAREAVVVTDDVWGRRLADTASIPVTPVAIDDAEELRSDMAGSTFRWRGHQVSLPLPGRFNVLNALAAATALSLLGVADADIARGLGVPVRVPGRMERVDAGQPFAVVVDYAHTPDGLAAVLGAARAMGVPGRLIVVFGCGGERDRAKRPEMGAVAAELADLVVLTADNSRSESTTGIIEQILVGLHGAEGRGGEHEVIEDRAVAIDRAVTVAGPGDVVIIAGKGHETTQTIGTAVVAFDDAAVARRALAARGWER